METITLAATAHFIDELTMCEYGSYEGRLKKREKDGCAKAHETHTVEILGRYKSVIKLKTPQEVCELYYVLGSGTIGLTCCKQANRLMNEIRETVREYKPNLVIQYPYQNGY